MPCYVMFPWHICWTLFHLQVLTLSQQALESKNQIATLETTRTTLTEELDRAREEVEQGQAWKDRLSALEDSHAFVRSELNTEMSQRKQCEATIAELTTEISSQKTTIEELTVELIQAKDARATMAAELALASEDSLYIEGRYGEQLAELTDQLADAKDRQQTLRSDLIEVRRSVVVSSHTNISPHNLTNRNIT